MLTDIFFTAELRCLFAQSDEYSGYIDKYFAKNPNPSISWIHELGKSRWGAASSTLLVQASVTADLPTRHVRNCAHTPNNNLFQPPQVLLSLGKLAELAKVSEDDSPHPDSSLEGKHRVSHPFLSTIFT